ncbi:MAG: hypothetical protein KDA65_16945 [Planctomycetaceae bacterium]|nr:hypothetical protein [Planctomycetaceae bacterium]
MPTSVIYLICCSTLLAWQSEGAPEVAFEPNILDPVKDRTLGIPPEESGAYYQLLYTIAHEDAAAAIKRAREFWDERREKSPELREFEHPHFADLFKHPEDYRGQVITQTGFVRRIVSYQAGENEFGIQKLYEAWIYPDTGQSNPVVVVFTVPPRSGLEVGENLNYHVGLTGYFFKLYGYRAQDTTRLAPMVLAGALEPLPLRVNPSYIEQRITFFLATTVVVLLIMGYILYTGLRRKRTSPVQASLPEQFPGIEEDQQSSSDTID